jgi:hypothetical protein
MAKKQKREYGIDDLREIAMQLGCRIRLEIVPIELLVPPQPKVQPTPKKDKAQR